MVYDGHINDIVNSYIYSDTPYDKVVPETTEELKKYLSDVTEQQVSDAILRKGEFKQETKKQLENELTQKKKDVVRLEKTKNKLSALEAGVDASSIKDDGAMTTEERKAALEKRKSDFEKEIDAKVAVLEKIKKDLSEKTKKGIDVKERIESLNKEIEYVKNNKSVFDSALKNPIKANEEILKARAELKDAYAKAGIRIESGSKTEIKIAQDAEKAIKEIETSSLSEDVKKEHIKEIEKSRDEQLRNTKQGVLVSLKDAVDSKVDNFGKILNDESTDTETANNVREIKNDLEKLSNRISPTKENLKDQIDKTDQDLTALKQQYKGTDFEKEIDGLQKEFRDNWQKTADEIQRKLLIDKAERNRKDIERQINAGQYTSIPTTEFDAKRDAIVAKKQAETQSAYKQLNSLAAKAKEQQQKENIADKYNKLRRELMVMSFGAIEKVGLSGITKPIIDPLISQTFGRLSGLITGVKPTELENLGKTFKQFRTQENADYYMSKMNDNYISKIINHDKAIKEFGEDSKEAANTKKELDKAELVKDASLAYLYLNAGSHIDIAQILLNGATDFDAKMGKYKQSFANERSKIQNMWYLIQSINRSHSAIKSVSHRQALLDEYIQNLQYFQNKDGEIINESRLNAWNEAVVSSEAGRFGEETALSRLTGRLKGSKSGIVRGIANFTLPVAKIGINNTKQGMDMMLPGLELAYKGIGEKSLKGFEELPLQQKKYINTLLKRGLFGLAQYALVGYLLSNGNMKYGGAYNPNDKSTVLGSDGKPLGQGEWEVGGTRMPELFNILMNHSPYTLPAAAAAVTYQNSKKGEGYKAVTGVVNEVYERLPFQGTADIARGLLGDKYSAEKAVASTVPSMKKTAEFFDKDEQGNPRAVKVNTGEFLSTTKNMIQKDVPVWRNYMENKSVGQELPYLNKYKDLGIKLPSMKDASSYKVKIDEKHPTGKMTDEEYEKFVPLVKKYSEENYKKMDKDKKLINELNKKIESGIKTPKDEAELTKAKDKVQNKIQAAYDNAIKEAKKKLKLTDKK
jgi:hypothetical protein